MPSRKRALFRAGEHGFQTTLQGFVLRTQRGNGFLAGADVGATAQGMVQPECQEAAAHVGVAAVEYGKQGRRFLPERVCVISRLRRVAASMPIYWLSVSSEMPSKCCGIRFCVRRM